MAKHFNGLTPEENELLTLLAEECAEVVQAVCKIQRHGLSSCHPISGENNRDNLCMEMGDVRAAMILLCEAGIVSKVRVHRHADEKRERVQRYLHHAVVTDPTPAERDA